MERGVIEPAMMQKMQGRMQEMNKRMEMMQK